MDTIDGLIWLDGWMRMHVCGVCAHLGVSVGLTCVCVCVETSCSLACQLCSHCLCRVLVALSHPVMPMLLPPAGLGLSPAGTEETIRNMTRNDLVDFLDTHYTANRFVIAGAGAVDHKQLADLTQKHFGRVPKSPKNDKVVQMEPAVFTGSDKLIRFDSMRVSGEGITAYSCMKWHNPGFMSGWVGSVSDGVHILSPAY